MTYLVKAVWSLATGIAAGEVSEAEARQRLERQLRHFDVDLARFPRELASCGSREDVRALLQALPPTHRSD